MGDSVGFAVDLENRYKGLRAPHKIKFGVSGCTRECAEAQGKDVGIIATEKGWNLYVCGNGGETPPRRTAGGRPDPGATRPAGGPLPDVIRAHRRPPAAHQHLARQPRRRPRLPEGRGGGRRPRHENAELEGQMQHVVDTYQCEWKTAVTNPAVRQRFRSFVNSDKADEHIIFVEERGQIRPARPDERAAAEPATRAEKYLPEEATHEHRIPSMERRLHGGRHPARYRRLLPCWKTPRRRSSASAKRSSTPSTTWIPSQAPASYRGYIFFQIIPK